MTKKTKSKPRNQVSCQIWLNTNDVILSAQKRYKKKNGVTITKCEVIDNLILTGYRNWDKIK